MTHVDGNAIIGDLTAIDLASAVATCDGCGVSGPVAAVMVYEGMGEVLRCPECGGVLVRVARFGGEMRLDMRGVRVLRWRSAG